jgi:hypothetical protein
MPFHLVAACEMTHAFNVKAEWAVSNNPPAHRKRDPQRYPACLGSSQHLVVQSVPWFGWPLAAGLDFLSLLSTAANADRVCRRVCDDGFCQSRCVDRGLTVHRFEGRDGWRDRDYYRDRRPGLEFHVPGVGIELGR